MLHKMKCLASVTLLTLLVSLEAANILIVTPVPSFSHQNVFINLVGALLSRGHNLTVFTAVSYENYLHVPNFKEVHLDQLKTIFKHNEVVATPSGTWLYDTGEKICDSALGDPRVKEYIVSDDYTFDLIMTESFYVECFIAFSHRYSAPLIVMSTHGTALRDDYYSGNPRPLAFVPDFTVPYPTDMTFFQRLHNTLRHLQIYVLDTYYHFRKQQKVVERHFIHPGSETIPPLTNILFNLSLVLVNSHFTTNIARPFVPKIVEVGGMHINQPKNLPENLLKIMDESTDGVIFFSLGSIVPPEVIGKEKILAFMNAFKKIKPTVLWKTNSVSIPEVPNNVIIQEWFPQADVLAHPKCVLFITHGGLLSQQEAIYFGVPTLGIPIFADQPMNIARSVELGIGTKLDYNNLTDKSILEAIDEVINQKKYQENVKRLSEVFKDRPKSALDTAVYWTEYVIRYRGAPFLHSQVTKLYWFQYLLLDVIFVSIVLFTCLLYLLYKIIKIIVNQLLILKTLKVPSDKKYN